MQPDQLVDDPYRLRPCAVADQETSAHPTVVSRRDHELAGRLEALLQITRAVANAVQDSDAASGELQAVLQQTAAAATRSLGARVSYVQAADVDGSWSAAVTPNVCVPVAGHGDGPGGHLHLEIPDGGVATAADRATLELLAGLAVDLAATRAREHESHETTTQLRLEVASAHEEAEHLQRALASNRQIGVALGVVVATYKVTPEQAFDLLRQESQNANRKLYDIADDVVLTGTLPAHLHQAARARAGDADVVGRRADVSEPVGRRYRIDLTLRPGHADLRISGDLDLTVHDDLTGLLTWLDEVPGLVRCDAHDVTSADSRGLAPIAAAARRRAEAGTGSLVIVRPSHAVRRVVPHLCAGGLSEVE